jgi:hypothetical protein
LSSAANPDYLAVGFAAAECMGPLRPRLSL